VSHPLKRVLFVCIGNACRSQMAEGFARVYGSDVLVPASAGLAPARTVASDTITAMDEKGISVYEQFPKAVSYWGRVNFDLVINLSGEALPDSLKCPVREWHVEDPVRMKYSAHCEVRDQIERLVMNLILELRREQAKSGLQNKTLA
jgi:arsenate reductase (thioredoxin)